MPPSAGACHTTLAELSPDCGRAPNWSSIMTAITCRLATPGVTRRPVSGAGTRPGVGSGVGLGDAVGLADAAAEGDGDGDEDGVGVRSRVGAGDGIVDAIATGSGVPSALIIPPATMPTASPTLSVTATTRPPMALLMPAARGGQTGDGARCTPAAQAWVSGHPRRVHSPVPVRAEDTHVSWAASIRHPTDIRRTFRATRSAPVRRCRSRGGRGRLPERVRTP